jgi:hypothetical protein
MSSRYERPFLASSSYAPAPAAEPGAVFLSEATQRLLRGLVEATFAGDHQIIIHSSRRGNSGTFANAPDGHQSNLQLGGAG